MCVVQQQITESRNRKKSLKRYLYLLLDSSYSTFCLNFKKSRSLLRLDNYIRLEILKQSVLSGPSKLGFKNFSLFFADKKSVSALVSIQSCHVILPTCCLANPRRAVTINHNCISVLKNKSALRVYLHAFQHSYDVSFFPIAPFSNLYATWVFDRRTSYTVLQVYLPSYMIVILSFMALWIPQEAVPARVGLGITTVLTIVYFLGKKTNNSIALLLH